VPEYVVVGRHAVFGFEPSTIFSLELDAVTEARLIGGGHIKLIADNRDSSASKGAVAAGSGSDISHDGPAADKPNAASGVARPASLSDEDSAK